VRSRPEKWDKRGFWERDHPVILWVEDILVRKPFGVITIALRLTGKAHAKSLGGLGDGRDFPILNNATAQPRAKGVSKGFSMGISRGKGAQCLCRWAPRSPGRCINQQIHK